MRVKSSKMLRSALCLMLAVLLTMGTCVTAFAEGKDDAPPPPPPAGTEDVPEKKIHYVSLGDSMTNGYGLAGYDAHGSNGYLEVAEEAYPNQVATHYDWELTQLATSAMRVEDLNFILGGNFAGDYWTEHHLLDNDYRWGSRWANSQGVSVSEKFQSAVTGADVISMAAGNANFGVFLLGRITNALGLFGDAQDDAWINFESALSSLDEESKAAVMGMYNQVQAYAQSKMPAELAEPLTRAVGYTLVSFVLNYNGALDRIVELNPDAEIIIVGLMNTMSGYELNFEYQGQTYTIDMEQILNLLIQPMNAYLAVLPAVKQAQGEYAEAAIYYTDVDTIAVMSESYRSLYMTPGKYVDTSWTEEPVAGNNTVRDRFVEGIGSFVGALMTGYGLETLVLTDVLAYEANPLGYAQTPGNKAMSVAIYLGLEEAVLQALEAEELTVSLDEIMGSASGNATDFLGNLLGETLGDLPSEIQANAASKAADAISAVAKFAGVEAALIQTAYTQNSKIGELNVKEVVDGYAALLATPETLIDALCGDDLVLALLNLYGRLKMGEGLSAHPSATGHDQLTDAIIETYDEKHTVQDDIKETVEIGLNKLYNILETYGPEVAAQVWQQWEEYGYVEAVDATIAELKTMLETRYDYYTETALPAITTAVDELGAQKDALCTELEALNTELAAKKAELDAVLAEQAIGDIYIPDISIDAELGGNEQTEVPEHECVVEGEGIEAELEAAIADLEHAIAVIEALIADITADMEDLLALAAEIAAAVEELEQTIASIGEAADDLAEAIEAAVAVLEDNEGVVNAVINSFNAGKAAVEAAAEVLELTLGTAEEMIADIDGMIAIIREDAETLYNKFMNDLPGCIEQIPEEAMMLVGGAVLLAQQGLEQGKALINAKLQEELNALSAEYSEEEIRAQIAELAAQYGIDEESINNEIESIKTQIETEVSERYAAIEADTIAQIDALKAEAQIKIDALNAELAGYQAELEAAAEEAKAEIQAQIDRVNGDIAVINEDLACAIGHLEEAAAIAYDEIVAEVTAAYETAMAELNTKLAELEAAYNEAVAALEASLDELQAAYEAAVAELTANAEQAIADLTAAVEAQIAELGKIGEDLAAVVDGIFAEMRDDLAAAQTAIGEILQGNLDAVEDLATALVDMGAEALVEAVENIREQLEIMFEEATTDDYGITEDSYYVALGDGSAVSQSYVDELAAHLGVDYTNLAQDGLAVEDAGAVIAANGDKIAAADLITLGFSNATFVSDAIDAGLYGSELDWSTYVTQDGVVYVEDALADISAHLAENGITGETNDMAVDAIEAYAYSSVAYACALPEVVNAIRSINIDATIIIVGQYNPFDGSIVELDGVQMDLGEYVDYLVDGAAVHGIAYCMLTGNAIYVEAPDADTDTPATLGLRQLGILLQDDSVLFPNEDGHEYIKNQILKALNYYVVEDYGMKGDVNEDGKVSMADVLRLVKYINGQNVEISEWNSKVTGDDKINMADLLRILKYINGQDVSFE